ncbi:MAG TPA: hypothetical protein VL989_00985 [Candidatus Sulfotelmatobacter sp.]|nr:hypothetical protein [Candidatus Sulfotelmatobacter sp.]
MYNFIVGGYLPGTGIQISFQLYVAFLTIAIGGGAIAWIEYQERVVKPNLSHKSNLDASALHSRLQVLGL